MRLVIDGLNRLTSAVFVVLREVKSFELEEIIESAITLAVVGRDRLTNLLNSWAY